MNTYLTPDLIFFILVAAFLILRLRSVLGRRTGNEKKPKDAYYYQDAAFDENQKKKSNIKAYKKPLNALEKNKGHISGMEKIVILDSNFNPKKFLSGAKVAFQKIIQSYANNEIDKIKYLLSNTVFSTFSKKISYRLKKKYSLEHTLVSLKSASIEKISVNSSIADIVVKFVSEQVNLLKNQKGNILEGNDEYIENHTDYWTFSKDLKSSNPNWRLIVTKSG